MSHVMPIPGPGTESPDFGLCIPHRMPPHPARVTFGPSGTARGRGTQRCVLVLRSKHVPTFVDTQDGVGWESTAVTVDPPSPVSTEVNSGQGGYLAPALGLGQSESPRVEGPCDRRHYLRLRVALTGHGAAALGSLRVSISPGWRKTPPPGTGNHIPPRAAVGCV